jgi:peptidoglycan hydrolase-like protein with peptidoglycan-binding domain
VEPGTPEQPASVKPPSNPAPLAREEVKEVQSRLRSLGFNPGPVDGDAGAMTAAAVTNYQQSRGQAQTGLIDRDLLAQLRQDPAPQPAPRIARADPPPRAAQSVPPRRSDPFEPVRSAGDRVGRWLQSLVR